MPSHRSAHWNASRLTLLALLAGHAAMTVAGGFLEARAEQEHSGVPVHVESPEDESCPATHNHALCQVAQALAGSLATPCADTHSRPAPATVVRLASVPEHGLPRPAFLTDCVVPRGPPLV